MKELLLKLALQECAKRGIGRAMRSEAEALTENILKIVDVEIDQLKERIAELEHQLENNEHNGQSLSWFDCSSRPALNAWGRRSHHRRQENK